MLEDTSLGNHGMDMKLLLLTDLQNLGSASPYASRYASRSAVCSSDTDRTIRAGTTRRDATCSGERTGSRSQS